MSIYRRVALYYRPFWRPTVLATTFTLASTAFNLLKVWPFAFLIDHVLRSGPDRGAIRVLGWDFSDWSTPSIVLGLCALIVLFHLLGGVLNLFTTLTFVRVGLQALLRMRTDL